MASPIPPTDGTETFLEWSHKARDIFEADLKRVHLSYRVWAIIIAVLLAFAGIKAWEWHVAKEARLEAEASAEHTRALAETKSATTWRSIAERHVDSVRVDTVRIARIVYRTPTFTAPVPVTAPDGTISAVPMPVVLRADFDSLGGTCNRLAHDCTAALAAKDSAAVHDSLVIASLYELNHTTTQRLSMANHAKLWSKILYGAAGASGGYLVGRASCPR